MPGAIHSFVISVVVIVQPFVFTAASPSSIIASVVGTFLAIAAASTCSSTLQLAVLELR
jgi:hypothetical protein